MNDEEWVDVAFTDDFVVAEFLLRLNRAGTGPSEPELAPAVQLEWTVRQRRSKPVLKKPEPTRSSPTTPLTWSGATSPSGGFEDGARSKIACKNEVTTMKRPRKKKTLAELKDEESLLMKERRRLKDTLATLRLNVEKQKAINGSLKKIKLDVETRTTQTNSNQLQPARSICDNQLVGTAAFGCTSIDGSYHFNPSNVSCKLQEIGALGTVRLLPDLNLPFQDDSSSELLCGMS